MRVCDCEPYSEARYGGNLKPKVQKRHLAAFLAAGLEPLVVFRYWSVDRGHVQNTCPVQSKWGFGRLTQALMGCRAMCWPVTTTISVDMCAGRDAAASIQGFKLLGKHSPNQKSWLGNLERRLQSGTCH